MTEHVPLSSRRINSIDILRGIVMIIMALDHTRDYFSGFKYEPTDLQHASSAMFFTRWITHFCAPVFIFLAGTSTFLSMRKGKSRLEQSRHLFTRGLWLIILELTVVYFGWMFSFKYHMVFLQVIWATGWCMIFLSLLIFLPRKVILFISLALIFGHDSFDTFHPAGHVGILWTILHVQGPLTFHHHTIYIIYPLIPWIGVMAAGYCFGEIFTKGEKEQKKWLYGIGLSAIALFIILRSLNGYGDPTPWEKQATPWRTVLSFLSDRKYPPSLLYLLMTLGPAITLLPLLEKMKGKIAGIFLVYGRVPLFYYILHIYLLHLMAVIAGHFSSGNTTTGLFDHPGYPLYIVYILWLSAVVILYFPCRWFMRIKMSHRKWWLSYL